jgi:hypothetical protein
MNQPDQPERTVGNPTSFGELLAAAEQIGTNNGDRKVIDLYRTWIALYGAEGRSRMLPGSTSVPSGATPVSGTTPSSPIAPRSRCDPTSPLP